MRLAAPFAEIPTLRIAGKSMRRPSGSAERVVAAVLLLFHRCSTSSLKSYTTLVSTPTVIGSFTT